MPPIHFCIDMQNTSSHSFKDAHWVLLKRNISHFVHELAMRGVPTIYVAFAKNNLFIPFDDGIGLYKDMPKHNRVTLRAHELLRFDMPVTRNSLVAFKRTYSLADEKSIKRYVERVSPSEIFLSGVVEDICIKKSGNDFAKDGYKVTIAAECTEAGIKGMRIMGDVTLGDRREAAAYLGMKVKAARNILAGMDREARRARPALRIKAAHFVL